MFVNIVQFPPVKKVKDEEDYHLRFRVMWAMFTEISLNHAIHGFHL